MLEPTRNRTLPYIYVWKSGFDNSTAVSIFLWSSTAPVRRARVYVSFAILLFCKILSLLPSKIRFA